MVMPSRLRGELGTSSSSIRWDEIFDAMHSDFKRFHPPLCETYNTDAVI